MVLDYYECANIVSVIKEKLQKEKQTLETLRLAKDCPEDRLVYARHKVEVLEVIYNKICTELKNNRALWG